jgi:hypothetical protein
VDRTRPKQRQTFLVEHYWPGITAEGFAAAAELVRSSAAEICAEGASLRFLHSTLVPGDEAAFCVFEAASSELVEDAYARAGVPFQRIVDALEMSRPS